jgi:hypothetical protein
VAAWSRGAAAGKVLVELLQLQAQHLDPPAPLHLRPYDLAEGVKLGARLDYAKLLAGRLR